MKMTVKGGAAVDPDSGIIGSLSVFTVVLSTLAAIYGVYYVQNYRFISLFLI